MLTRALGLEGARLVSLCGGGGKSGLMFALAGEWAAAGERVLVTTTTHIAAAEAEGHSAVSAASAKGVLVQARRLDARLVVATAGPGLDPGKRKGLLPGEVDALARDGWFTRVLVEADGSKHRPLKAPASHEPVFPGTTEVVVMVAGLGGIGCLLDEHTVFRHEIWSRLTGLPAGALVTPESLAQVVVDEQGLAKGSPAGARRVLFLNQADDTARAAAGRAVRDFVSSLPGRRPDRTVIGRLLPVPEVIEICLV